MLGSQQQATARGADTKQPHPRWFHPIFVALILISFTCSKDSTSPETTAPARVDDFRAFTTSSTRLRLTWTAPADNEAPGTVFAYEIRVATEDRFATALWDSAGALLDSFPAPSEPGTLEEWFVGDLKPGTRYFFALRSRDGNRNWSELSNVAEDETLGGDTTAPAAITGLGTVGFPSASRVTLGWLAPGDDGDSGRADQYQIRQSPDSLTQAGWDTSGVIIAEPTPQLAGEFENFAVTGLTPETVYYFAIRTADERENWSDISNVLRVQTPPVDTRAPAAVADLNGRLLSPRDIEITWTAPGDDGSLGQAESYDLRWASEPQDLVDRWNELPIIPTEPPLSAGSAERVTLSDLPPRTTFFFGLFTLDDARNRSDFSNIAAVQTSDSICVVLADGTGDFPTIGEAARLGTGCIIELGDGHYTGPGNRDWGTQNGLTLRSISGIRDRCVIDFEGEDGFFPAGTHIEGVSLQNSPRIITAADATTGEALTARNVRFQEVRLSTTGSADQGPSLNFEACEIREAVGAPFASAGVLRFLNCEIRENEAGLAVGYDVLLEDCRVFSNSGTAPLIRGFVDLTQESRISLLRTEFLENSVPLVEPRNVAVALENCLFVRNSGGILLIEENASVSIATSTFFANTRFSGSCIYFERMREGVPSIEISRSIFAANGGGPIISGDLATGLTLACSDVIANDAGDYVGLLSVFADRDGNIAEDPRFCGIGTDNYELTADSPCAPKAQPECGRIGARDIGCP